MQVVESVPLVQLYYDPLSQHERRVALAEHLEKVKTVQERISKTIFTKHFADFSHYILAQEEALFAQDDMQSILGADWLSLNTVLGTLVIASPQASRESLLKFGYIIDELFPNKGCDNPMYIIEVDESNDVRINEGYLESPWQLLESYHAYHVDNREELVDRVSKEVFGGTKCVSHCALILDDESGL